MPSLVFFSFSFGGIRTFNIRATLFFFFFLRQSLTLSVAQAGRKLLASSNPPASAYQNAGIIGVSHHDQPPLHIL